MPQGKYDQKAKHKQLSQLMCSRCQALSNGAMIPAVEDLSIKLLLQQQQQQHQQQDKVLPFDPTSDAAVIASSSSKVGSEASAPQLELAGKRLVSPEELRQRLRKVANERCLVVLLVDLLDVSGSFLSRARDLVGKNPVILVGTKADLLPAGTKADEVTEWLLATAAHKRLNAVSAYLVSSRTGDGLGAATSALRRERKGRDVYVLGAANVGKSAFVRAMVREMSSYTSDHFDPAAAGAAKRLPVESAMPGTTLDLIPMQTFSAGGTLYDTPGVHLHHRIIHLLDADDVKALQPRKRLSPYVAPTPRQVCDELALEDELEEDIEPGADGVAIGLNLDISEDSTGAVDEDGDADAEAGALQMESEQGLLKIDLTGAEHASPSEAPGSGSGGAKPSWDASDEELLALFGPLAGYGADAAIAAGPLPAAKKGASPRSTVSRRRSEPEGPPASATYMWGGVARIDVVSCPSATHLVFYTPPAVSVAALPLLGEDDYVEIDMGDDMGDDSGGDVEGDTDGHDEGDDEGDSNGLFGQLAVERRGGLQVAKETTVEAIGTRGAIADVVFSGLPGWVQVFAPRDKGSIQLRLWAPRGVEVFVRPPIPVPSPLT